MESRLAAPRVSVLMAVFNTVEYLQEALSSISNQSFRDFEIVVIDDGSDDGSSEILKSFASKEPRMRLTLRKNIGIVATRNELLASARGDLVAWMDSDDVSALNRLAFQVNKFDDDPLLVCLGAAAQCIDPEGHPLNVERYPLDHSEIVIEQRNGGAMRFPTTMMRREAALKVDGFREPFRIGEDFDFLLRLSELGKMANLPDTLYFYRQHLYSVCATLGSRWAAYRDQILELARERREYGRDRLQKGGTISIDAQDSGITQRFVARTYAQWARYSLQNGNRRLAWKYSRLAIYARPAALGAWKILIRVMLNLKPTEH